MIRREEPNAGSDGVLNTTRGPVIEPRLMPSLIPDFDRNSLAVAKLKQSDFADVRAAVTRLTGKYPDLRAVVLVVPAVYDCLLEPKEIPLIKETPQMFRFFVVLHDDAHVPAKRSVLSPEGRSEIQKVLREAIGAGNVKLAGMISERRLNQAESRGLKLNSNLETSSVLNDFAYIGEADDFSERLIGHLCRLD